MTDARQFAVEFFRHWQPIINFVVPAEMVADLEERVRVLVSTEYFDALRRRREEIKRGDAVEMPHAAFQDVQLTLEGRWAIEEVKKMFDGSTGTPPSGQAGYTSPPVPGTNNG